MSREFDVIVIGAGPAGEVLAGRLGERGEKSVALIERELLGGECSYWACMPSKALLRPAELRKEVERVPGVAGTLEGKLDVDAVLSRRDEVIHELDDSGHLPWLEERGVEVLRETARLEGERQVRVGEELLRARDAVVVATGTGPLVPPIPGLAEAGAWSSREITTAKEVPGRLLVLGGGVVGVEMAQAWSALGSEVTLIESASRLLGREEPFAGEQVAAGLREHGVEILLDAEATAVSREGEQIAVELEDGKNAVGERLLVAIGRAPRTKDLGLETIGLEPGESIEVDETLRAPGREWLYAIGDVNGRSLLTHSGKYQARLAAEHILGRRVRARFDDAGAPRVTFTEPQVAAVGHTLATAEEAGIEVTPIDLETAGTAGASFHGRGAEGTTRFLVDSSEEILVGATFVGPDVAEMLQAATIAVVARVPLSILADAIAPFPTRSELWLNFLEAYEGERPEAEVHSRTG